MLFSQSFPHNLQWLLSWNEINYLAHLLMLFLSRKGESTLKVSNIDFITVSFLFWKFNRKRAMRISEVSNTSLFKVEDRLKNKDFIEIKIDVNYQTLLPYSKSMAFKLVTEVVQKRFCPTPQFVFLVWNNNIQKTFVKSIIFPSFFVLPRLPIQL